MTNSINLFIIFVIFLTIIAIIPNNRNKINSKEFMIRLIPYKLENEKYITSVHYVNYENKIKIIIYSTDRIIKFNSCLVKYDSKEEICNPKLIFYGGNSIFNLMEVSTKPNNIPYKIVINNITIDITKPKRNDTFKFISCFSVMSNYDRPLMLTELIETNIYFGVSKLVFYYHSASQKVIDILKYYSDIGIADVYQYKAERYFKEIERRREHPIYNLIYSKMNHCFNEYKTQSNHMLFLDLDEILWPVKAKNYEELINSIPKRDFYFINAFLYKAEYNIPNYLDKNSSIILPDVDIFSIKKYCPNNDGFIHKYIMLDTNKFIATEMHNSITTYSIIMEYLSIDVAYIRHTRHYNDVIKEHCPDSKLINVNNHILEKNIYKKSIQIMNRVL